MDYRDDELVLTTYVRPLPGVNTCQGNPATPFLLRLDEPLGDRELVNGAQGDIARQPLEVEQDALGP